MSAPDARRASGIGRTGCRLARGPPQRQSPATSHRPPPGGGCIPGAPAFERQRSGPPCGTATASGQAAPRAGRPSEARTGERGRAAGGESRGLGPPAGRSMPRVDSAASPPRRLRRAAQSHDLLARTAPALDSDVAGLNGTALALEPRGALRLPAPEVATDGVIPVPPRGVVFTHLAREISRERPAIGFPSRGQAGETGWAVVPPRAPSGNRGSDGGPEAPHAR